MPMGLGIGLSPVFGGSAPTTYDYYVDASVGDDGNDGSYSSPFATIDKLSTLAQATPQDGGFTALVRAGDYTGGQRFSTGANYATGMVFSLTFESGCTMQGVLGEDASAFAIGASTTTIYGNGLHISDYNAGTGNGLGASDSGYIIAYDVEVSNCVDGMSCHNSSTGKFVRVHAHDCTKSCFAHIDTTITEHVGCTFEALGTASLGAGSVASTATATFDGCAVVPAANGAGCTFGAGCTVRNCTIGTLAQSGAIALVAGAVMDDCFVHMHVQANGFSGMMRRCYGKFSYRNRTGGSGLFLENCIIAGPSTFVSANFGILYVDFASGGASEVSLVDSIIMDYSSTTAIGYNVGAEYAAYIVDAGLNIENVLFYGNGIDIDPDIVADDGYTATGVITGQDPLTGDMTSTDQSDWGYGVGSPCIGAGSGGGNIGFPAAS